ncbi:MAG: hydroxyacid dehydrogenase [Pseudomonadota bacterium]
MSTPTVVITARALARAGLDVLERAGCRVVFVSDGTVGSLLEIVQREPIDAILCRGSCPGDVIRAAKGLKVISRHGVGYDAVDVAAASERGIPVMIAQGANAQSVAELVFALLLSLARSLEGHTRVIRQGRWERKEVGVQLSGKVMGIVGLGTIGTKVALLAHAFGMTVIAYDIKDKRGAVGGVEIVGSLDELLGRSGVVSLHTPLTSLTEHMMGDAQFALMPPGAIFINTSRGEVVDEAALHRALASGLRGAGLDVHQTEKPQADNPVRKHLQVVLTPHIGAQTDVALEQVAVAAAQHIVDVLQGRPVQASACVNLTALPGFR